MTGLLMLLVLLALCSLVAHVTGIFRTRPRQSAYDKVRTELFVADQKLSVEHHRARRAMNKAAGQDWRNLAG